MVFHFCTEKSLGPIDLLDNVNKYSPENCIKHKTMSKLILIINIYISVY